MANLVLTEVEALAAYQAITTARLYVRSTPEMDALQVRLRAFLDTKVAP